MVAKINDPWVLTADVLHAVSRGSHDRAGVRPDFSLARFRGDFLGDLRE